VLGHGFQALFNLEPTGGPLGADMIDGKEFLYNVFLMDISFLDIHLELLF